MNPFTQNVTEFSLGPCRKFKNGYTREVAYENMPLRLKSAVMRNVFGLSNYQNQGKYTMTFEFDDDYDSAAFMENIEWVEEQVMKQAEEHGADFCSAIKHKEKYPSTLRVKLKNRGKAFDCLLFGVGDAFPGSQQWKVGDEHVKHNDFCRIEIEAMPVWKVNNRYGISWKVVSVQKQ